MESNNQKIEKIIEKRKNLEKEYKLQRKKVLILACFFTLFIFLAFMALYNHLPYFSEKFQTEQLMLIFLVCAVILLLFSIPKLIFFEKSQTKLEDFYKETPLDVINNMEVISKINKSSVDELFEDDWYKFFPWNLEQTKEILAKCSNIEHYARLNRWAFKCWQCPHFYNGKRIAREVVELTYFELCTHMSLFLKDGIEITVDRTKLMKKTYDFLDICWNNNENSDERIMLQKRLEVEWFKSISIMFEDIKSQNPTSPKQYEELFCLCKKDDPKILEIAEEINKLS